MNRNFQKLAFNELVVTLFCRDCSSGIDEAACGKFLFIRRFFLCGWSMGFRKFDDLQAEKVQVG